MTDFSVEMKNEDTCDVLVRSFDSEEKRDLFIEQLPPHVSWTIYENMNLFSVDKEMALG